MRNAGVITQDESGVEYFIWPTNLMGKARMEVQIEPEGMTNDDLLIRQFGYTLIFVALVIYTIMFLFRYLKRLLMLTFLTIIAPFVAMTYPLDKLNDGNAQAFNMWLKEYIFNLLIQPVHLVLYTVLIGSAMDFAADNLLYSIAALGFMLQAEKIMRRFFGFDKASTLEGGSALGGALAMQGINQLRKLTGGNKKQKSDKDGNGNSNNTRISYRTPNSGNSVNDLIDTEYGGNNAQLPQGRNGQVGENNNEPQTAQQRMADAYDENYGTNNFDPTERDAMAREAYEPEGMNYSEEDYRGILRDSGYSEDEINDMISKDPRYANNNATNDQIPTSSPTTPQVYSPNTGTRRQENTSTQRRKTHRIKGALGVVGAGVKYVAPKAARLAIKGTVAGAAGMAGMAAGLVSDDYSNVFKYGAAGLGAGWIAGGGISSVPGKINEFAQGAETRMTNAAEQAAIEYANTAYGPEAAARRQKQIEDARAERDKERRKLYSDKLGVSGVKPMRQLMRDAQKYREAGITDDEIIIKAMQNKDFNDERAGRKRIILAGLAQEVGKDKKELDRMKQGLEDKGIDKEEIKKYEKAIKEINNWNY